MAKLRQWFKDEGALKDLWNSVWVGIPLWILCGAFTLYWFYSVPPPGYAIGALAVVAGIMSVREMKTLAKVSWVFLLVCLLIMEFRAIDKDRADNDQKQKDFFEAQKQGFQGIATQSETNFKETAKGLDASIKGLQSIFNQTTPHAELVSGPFTVLSAPVPPEMFKAGTDYQFDFHYVNGGNKQGMFLKSLGEIYVDKPDDMSVQIEIKKQFEKSWTEQKTKFREVPVLSQGQEYWSEHRTFSDAEIDRLRHQGQTIYAVSRIEYSDPTGKWYSDRCDHYQVTEKGLWIQVLHSCFVMMNGRYPARQP